MHAAYFMRGAATIEDQRRHYGVMGVTGEQLQQAWDAFEVEGRTWCVARSSALDFTVLAQPAALWAILV